MLEPGTLTDVAIFFENHPGIDVVSGVSWIINANGSNLRKFFSDEYCLWMAARGASVLSQASTFFRASAFKKTSGFNIKNFIAWDGELFADMASNGAKFARCSKIWSKFRIYEAGITGSGRYDAENKEYAKALFKKIAGREVAPSDTPIIFFAKTLRKILNLKDTFERIFYGPIYKRKL